MFAPIYKKNFKLIQRIIIKLFVSTYMCIINLFCFTAFDERLCV